jgi:hypothetical protein
MVQVVPPMVVEPFEHFQMKMDMPVMDLIAVAVVMEMDQG